MEFDPAQLARAQNARLLMGCVVPRPIGWISSLHRQGTVNVAPFSFFNGVTANPPSVMFSCGRRADGTRKDTAENIVAQGEFVFHVVDGEHASLANLTAISFPSAESEATALGLEMVPSRVVKVPRIATTKVQMECRLYQVIPITMGHEMPQTDLFIGKVVWFHIRDGICQENGRIDVQALDPIGRLGSAQYSQGGEIHTMQVPTYEQWCMEQKK